jgi:predicted RNA-binding Zn ribbon-like protein
LHHAKPGDTALTTDRTFLKRTSENGKPLIGGRLALDFANLTIGDAASDGSEEGFAVFIEFLAEVGMIPAEAKPALLSLWTTEPDEAAGFLLKAISLQSTLRNVFEARISGAEILPEWIEAINEILAHTEGYDRLEPNAQQSDGQPEWRIALHARAQGLEWLLTAIARTAAELIAEGRGAPIRKCANPNCGLFFYDDSRTGRRRWCSMAVCGNRAKVSTHYRREKNNN